MFGLTNEKVDIVNDFELGREKAKQKQVSQLFLDLLTLFVKHHRCRPNRNVPELSIADNTERNNSEDADDGTRTRNSSVINRVLWPLS